MGYTWTASTTTSSGSTNLLEGLRELRKRVHLLDYHFTIQDITQEQSDGRDVKGKVWGKDAEPPYPEHTTLPKSLYVR